MKLKDKTIIITGASRGIGREIALRCAADGAQIVIAAKTDAPHPKLPGTIFTVAKEVESLGGKALPVKVDVRSEEEVLEMTQRTKERFGGIDILINNAGAISLTPTDATPMKKYDLMMQINVRAVFLCTQACLPYLRKSDNPHILNMSPPISLDPRWYKANLAYTISKFGMTMCTLGMAAEFEMDRISVNSLWPKTLIASAATRMLFGEGGLKQTRKPQIMAEAVYQIIATPRGKLTGQALVDENYLRSIGQTHFEQYAYDPTVVPQLDYYVNP